ncbi:MAG: hypothetical protein AAGG48_11770 [Planctomycetota bacterium]
MKTRVCQFLDISVGEIFIYRLAVYRKLGHDEAIRMRDREGRIIGEYDMFKFLDSDHVTRVGH